MAIGLLVLLRILQCFVAFVVLGLSAYVAHWYNSETLTASPSQINFLILTAIFTFVGLLYLELIPRYPKARRVSHPYANFALEIIITIFYFAGFIALGVFLSKLLFCRGSVCAAARADVATAGLGFLLWLITSIILGLEIFKGGLRAVQGNVAMKVAMQQA